MATSGKEVRKSHQQEFDDLIQTISGQLGHAMANMVEARSWAYKMKLPVMYGKCDAYIEMIDAVRMNVENLKDELDARLAS